MSQRRFFVNGLLILAVLLFALRMWIVNSPEAGEKDVPPETVSPTEERFVQLPAQRSGWTQIGRGPMLIIAEGKIDIGGLETVPNDKQKPGDASAFVPDLPYGTLVGKVGENGEPFKIGRIAQVAMKEIVYVAINDSDHTDNRGAYTLKLSGELYK